MKHVTVRTLAIAALLTAGSLACGQSGQSTSGPSPCAILDDALIRAQFAIAADVALTRTPSSHSPHPLCTVRWRKPDAAEIEARSGAAMSDYMQRKMRGEDVKMPSFNTTDEVSLTLNEPPSEDQTAALAAFDSAMQRLVEGMSHTRDGVTATLQADLVPVEGVGNKAMWAASLHQLSVVSGTRIFHVTVNTGAGNEADMASASAIARQVAAGL